MIIAKQNGESIKINMKSLYESLFDIDDNVDNVDRSIVEKFLKDNYIGSFIISNKPNKDGKYEVSCVCGVVAQKNITSLTNDMFVWTEMDGEFSCCRCDSLTSLKGAPKKVGHFFCNNCKSLKSLEGAPEEVRLTFDCKKCNSLTSLKGAPKKVGGEFNCMYCKSLMSLKGAPKKTTGFRCEGCGGEFTEYDVKKVSNVNRYITADKSVLKESILDIEDNISDFELTDLYSLIKDRIKTINYQYTSLGFTHFNNESACKKYIKDHRLETLKTVNGKEAPTGKILINLLPAILQKIIVNKDFITHKNDDSYMTQSIKVSSDFFRDNGLIAEYDNNASGYFKHPRKYLYIGVEMKRGALCIYYDTSDELPDSIRSMSHGHKGMGYVSIRLV